MEKGTSLMMELKQVHIAYQKKEVLSNFSLKWEGNDLLVLGGVNGSGKSSLIKCMNQLLDYEGSIKWNEVEVHTMKDHQRAKHFAYVSQQKMAPLHESVEEFLLLGSAFRLSLFEKPTKKQFDKIDEVLEAFDLMHLKGCFMDELSGGEVQMLYVARCFMEKHDVLLLDEPCTYLDYHRQYLFMKQLKCLLKQNNMGAIISIHDPNLALYFADHVVLLNQHVLFYDHKINTNEDKYKAALKWNLMYENAFCIENNNHHIQFCFKRKRSDL